MNGDDRFYVYVLFRPWDGSPCYIGKGCKSRMGDHERYGEAHYNSHLAAIIKKAAGRELPKIVIRSRLTEDEAFEIEKAFIAAIGRKSCGGPLANQTDGGDGPSGCIVSKQTREKLSRLHSGRVVSEETRQKHRERMMGNIFNLGKTRGEETKKKISEANRERKVSPETRAKIAINSKNRSAETRAKMSAAAKGHKRGLGRVVSVETRAKISASKRKANLHAPL